MSTSLGFLRRPLLAWRSRLGRKAVAAAIALACASSAAAARASGSDSDDEDAAIAHPRAVARKSPPHAKAIAFDKAWLEPFFTQGLGRKAVAEMSLEHWDKAAALFAKAAKADHGAEALAARAMAAEALANLGRWDDAEKAFTRLVSDDPLLAPYHAYDAARSALRAGHAAAALTLADKVEEDSVPEAEAELVRLDAFRALGRWHDAAVLAARYLERFPNGPRRAEATFRLAEAQEKDSPDEAPDLGDLTTLYRKVWAEAPLEAWADRAAERLDAIAATLPPAEALLVKTRTADEWMTRGMALFERNRNQESEQAFANVLGAPGLDADLTCRAKYHRAQSVWKQRNRPRAAPLFDDAEVACATAGNRDLHAKALYQGARCHASKGEKDEALARYARVEAEHPDHSYADDALVRAAEVLDDGGRGDEAAARLATLPEKYPQGDLLNEALWRLAFRAYRAGGWDEALKWLDENLRRIPREEIWYAEGRALYWKGRVLARLGRTAEATASYERAVREYPLSVYALLALTRIKATVPGFAKHLVEELRKGMAETPPWTFPPRALYGEKGFRRAVFLARMGQGSEARRELAHLGLETAADKKAKDDGKKDTSDDDVRWMTAILLDRAGNWSASSSLPRYGMTDYRWSYPKGLGAAKWRISYPRAFPDLVAKNAKANDVPESLQTAIMREESAFNPRIESFANAIGLTQMIMKTAQRFANGQKVSRELLLDPAKNLEIGSRFLGFLWKRWDHAPPLTIASYNAGEAAVERWLEERGAVDSDEFMELVPYDETRNYTKRVLASMFAYAWLYDAKHPVPEVPLVASKPGAKSVSAKAER